MYLFRNMQNVPQEKLSAFLVELSEKAVSFGLFEIGQEYLIAVSCQKTTMEDIITRYHTVKPLYSNMQRQMKRKKKNNVLTQKP